MVIRLESVKICIISAYSLVHLIAYFSLTIKNGCSIFQPIERKKEQKNQSSKRKELAKKKKN